MVTLFASQAPVIAALLTGQEKQNTNGSVTTGSGKATTQPVTEKEKETIAKAKAEARMAKAKARARVRVTKAKERMTKVRGKPR